MALTIIELHRRSEEKLLNDEWFIVENTSDKDINTRGCFVTMTKGTGKKPIELAKLDPGFKVVAGGKLRVVAGSPGTKAHGKAPDDDIENYFLLGKKPLLRWKSGLLKVAKGQMTLAMLKVEG